MGTNKRYLNLLKHKKVAVVNDRPLPYPSLADYAFMPNMIHVKSYSSKISVILLHRHERHELFTKVVILASAYEDTARLECASETFVSQLS